MKKLILISLSFLTLFFLFSCKKQPIEQPTPTEIPTITATQTPTITETPTPTEPTEPTPIAIPQAAIDMSVKISNEINSGNKELFDEIAFGAYFATGRLATNNLNNAETMEDCLFLFYFWKNDSLYPDLNGEYSVSGTDVKKYLNENHFIDGLYENYKMNFEELTIGSYNKEGDIITFSGIGEPEYSLEYESVPCNIVEYAKNQIALFMPVAIKFKNSGSILETALQIVLICNRNDWSFHYVRVSSAY